MRTRARVLAVVQVAALLCCALPGGAAEKKPLRLEEIFAEGGLTGRMPAQLRWSPDGRRLTYILRKGERRDLWVMEAASGEKRILVSHEHLTSLAPAPEQATTDERERERLLRYEVAAYLWSPDSKTLLFASGGQLYLFDPATSEARPLAPGKRGVRDPKFSPDGHWVSFVYEHDLWLAPVEGGKEIRLTAGGNEDLLHGDLDWLYPEELEVRTGYHWSPDSHRIAFLELDEHPVPRYPIPDLVSLATPTDFQRYPKAGDPNPRARVGIVEVKTARRAPAGLSATQIVWLDRAAEYLPRITWVDNGRVAVQLLNRAQNEIELVLADAASGHARTVLIERDPYWINVTNDLRFLPDSEEFLWTSERTGFRHLYLYRLTGKLKRTLTAGEWEVRSLEGLDEKNGWVYYTSTERNPLGSDLYRVKLDGSHRERVTELGGTHRALMNPAATAWADTYSALATVPRLRLHNLSTGRTALVHSARSLEGYALVEPEAVELKAPDGALVRGQILKPPALEAGRKYPVLVYVYGGPHAPVIRDAWGRERYLFHQYLAQQGFVVFAVDDRASSLPGHKYEAALHYNYGPTALADHRVAVSYLRSLPYVDPERIGLWGWSGGGFSTCFALTHSDLFKVGIAVAPVTDWRLYDSIYTERYMGLPQEQAEAYRKTSAVEAAGNLHGRLLLVHGDADDNVHIQNTVQFLDALIEAGKNYDLMVYPRKTHSLRGAKTREHLFRALADYLKKHL